MDPASAGFFIVNGVIMMHGNLEPEERVMYEVEIGTVVAKIIRTLK